MPAMSRRTLFKTMRRAAAPVDDPAQGNVEIQAPQFIPKPPALLPSSPVDRLLGRAGYGPMLGERETAHAQGYNLLLNMQLDPGSIDDSVVDGYIANLTYYNMSIDEMRQDEENGWYAYRDLLRASVLRKVYSKRQLYEKMVEFWSDHFNIYMWADAWPDMPFLKIIDDRDVIRPHAMGYFRDLLWASMRSPAMLYYLDNVWNRVYTEDDTPNENYARELLELHSVGVDAGYTHADVQNVARILTGWATEDIEGQHGEFLFHPFAHDYGSKTVMGQYYPPGRGEEEVADLLDQLVTHPETPKFLARKLIQRFAVDNGVQYAGYDDFVDHVASAYGQDGDITAMLDALFNSDAFQHPHLPAKFKRPFDVLVSMFRGLAVPVIDNDAADIDWDLSVMGQPFMQWSPPNGYPDVSGPWLNNMLPRWNFATHVTQGWSVMEPDWTALETYTSGSIRNRFDQLYYHLTGVKMDNVLLNDLAAFVNGYQWPEEFEVRLHEAVALMICSPNFHWV